MLWIDDIDRNLTKERRFSQKQALLIIVPIYIVLVMLFAYFILSQDTPKEPLLGIKNLHEALDATYIFLLLVFDFFVVNTVVGTWINLRRSNLNHTIMGVVDKGAGVNTNRSRFCQADDEKLVQVSSPDMKSTLNGLVFYIIIILIPISIFSYHVWDQDVTIRDSFWITISILLTLTFMYNLCFPNQRIEFNRLEPLSFSLAIAR